MPHQEKFLYGHGSYKIPVYKEEEYTRWRTTTYQINDWIPENWPAINAQITLTGNNGYEGDVQLSVTTGTELLDASLENQVVDVESTATTNLTIQPQRELSGSITRTRKVVDHYATRKIYDTRQVFTGRYNKVCVGEKMVKDGYEWKTTTVTKERWVRGHWKRYRARKWIRGHWKRYRARKWVPGHRRRTYHGWTWVPGYWKNYWRTKWIPGYYITYWSRKWVPGHKETYTVTERYKSWNYKPVKQYRKEPIYRTEKYVKQTELYPVYRIQKYTASTSGSTHTITVTAQDDCGGRKKQVSYSLELQTLEKPPTENTILSIEETDTKPSDLTEPPTHKPGSRLGVEGSVYDAVERGKGVSDGLKVTVDEHSADKVWGNNYMDIDVITVLILMAIPSQSPQTPPITITRL